MENAGPSDRQDFMKFMSPRPTVKSYGKMIPNEIDQILTVAKNQKSFKANLNGKLHEYF